MRRDASRSDSLARREAARVDWGCQSRRFDRVDFRGTNWSCDDKRATLLIRPRATVVQFSQEFLSLPLPSMPQPLPLLLFFPLDSPLLDFSSFPSSLYSSSSSSLFAFYSSPPSFPPLFASLSQLCFCFSLHLTSLQSVNHLLSSFLPPRRLAANS